MKKFTLGADPELFLMDAANSLVSAIDKIGGSKTHPKPLPIGEGFAVQEDNVAMEYNIPPSLDKGVFVNNIQSAMSYLTNVVGEMGLKVSELSAANFPPLELIHPAAKMFGCDPDFNAWKRGERNVITTEVDSALRTCGGHVHVGYRFDSTYDVMQFTKYLDLFLGVSSTLMDDGELRKSRYGKAGAFRYKPYGMEYRVLSNYWVFKPTLVAWVWESVEAALDAWESNKIDIDSEQISILTAINGNNKEMAQQLVAKYSLSVL